MRPIDADRLVLYLNDYALSETPAHDKVYQAIMNCIDAVKEAETVEDVKPRWIPVTEKMPPEEDSVFTRLKGTDKWVSSMPLKVSTNVLVTVEFENGSRAVMAAYTADGVWKTEYRLRKQKVIAWMPFPEPYREHKEEEQAK